jgi:hypothetical protein
MRRFDVRKRDSRGGSTTWLKIYWEQPAAPKASDLSFKDVPVRGTPYTITFDPQNVFPVARILKKFRVELHDVDPRDFSFDDPNAGISEIFEGYLKEDGTLFEKNPEFPIVTLSDYGRASGTVPEAVWEALMEASDVYITSQEEVRASDLYEAAHNKWASALEEVYYKMSQADKDACDEEFERDFVDDGYNSCPTVDSIMKMMQNGYY